MQSLREKRKEKLAGRGLLAAAGISLALHGAFIASGWNGLGWLGKLLESNRLKPEPEPAMEAVLLPVEIKQFYSDWKKEAPNDTPVTAPDFLSDGPGWMKKMETPAFVTDEITYASYVRDLIVGELAYPASMKKEGIEVAVRVVFSLNKEGKILSLEIPADNRSAHEAFNTAALDAVRRAASRFPPFPPAVQKPDQRFSFLLLFRPDMN